MTAIPGTYFTKEELYAYLKSDNITGETYSDIDKPAHFGWVYYKRLQYPKAVAWCLLSASKGNLYAQGSIAEFYQYGTGLPLNPLCALKWYSVVAKQNIRALSFIYVGEMFEYGQGVAVDNNKALAWYHYGGESDSVNRLRLENGDFHRHGAEKYIPLEQLIRETEALVDTEKKKLEVKQNKTPEEIESLEQLKITYKLVDGGEGAWKDIPIIVSDNKSTITYKNEILGLKSKIQSFQLEKIAFEGQAQQIQLLEQQLAKEKRKSDALKREIKLLKRREAHQKTNVQPTGPLSNGASPKNVGSSHLDLSDDPLNDINYDTEESNDDDPLNDINYDTEESNGDHPPHYVKRY